MAITSSGNAAVSAVAIDPAVLHKKLVARGVGKGVKVTEINGTELKGVLVTIDADSFQIIPSNAAQPTRILNAEVAKIGKSGLSPGAKMAIGVTAGVIGFMVIGGAIAAAVIH